MAVQRHFTAARQLNLYTFTGGFQYNCRNHFIDGVKCRKVLADGFFYVVAFAQVDVVFCAAVAAAAVEIAQDFAQGFCSHALVCSIDGGVYLEALSVGIFAVFLKQLLTHHFGNVQGALIDVLYKTLVMQLFFQSLIALLQGNHAFFQHIVQNISLTQFGTLRVHNRVVGRRCFRQAGQHGGLGQC